MLKFDKLKLVSTIENISNIDEKQFQSIIKEGKIKERKFSLQSPFALYIEADYEERELIIEFTGKILGDDYPQLISRETIQQCLNAINKMGLCSLNTTGILADAKVVKADVCNDVAYADCKALTKSLRACISNYHKYLVRTIGGNFVIEKNVTTKGLKQRLTIYDKAKELQKASNRSFLDLLYDKQLLLDYFAGKVRFELNLNSKEQIRKLLEITDTSIDVVLGSSANPIWKVLEHALTEGDAAGITTTLTDLKNRLVLEHCDNDLAKVESLLRNYCSPNTHISQVMKPFRALAAKLSDSQHPTLKQQLRQLLFCGVIFFGFVSV